MRSVPEPRSSHSPGGVEEPDTSEPVPAHSKDLKVVPKSRLGARESALADRVFKGIVILCAVAVLAIVGLIVVELLHESRLSMHMFGFKFLVKQTWDPVAEDFGALPFIYGTAVSSLVAL